MAWPTSVTINNASLESVTPTVRTRSLSGIETRSQLAQQYFVISANFSGMTREQSQALFAFFMSNGGSLNSFALPLPSNLGDNSEGFTGSLSVTSNTDAGETSLSVTKVGTGAVFKAGDLFTFSNHSKVYMVTQDFTSGTLNFFPALSTAVFAGNDIAVNDVEMTVRLTNDNIVQTIQLNNYRNYSIDFREVIE